MDRRLSSSSSSSSQPPFSTPRRRFTSPPGSQAGGTTPATPAPSTLGVAEKDNKIEILFSHPASKVVNFTVSAKALEQPDLPWRGPEERTIASGPLRIYRTLPQEVAFLQSGSALRPLLKRTQCWNVDGNRIFCLQLRPGNYWRIEILGPEEDQAPQIEAFKKTLSDIVAYEITTCPFIRAPECEPLVGHPELLAPARVWSRAHLRRVSETPAPPIEGFSFIHVPHTEPAYDTRSVKSGGDERPRRSLDFHDERDCRSDYSSGSTSGPSLVSQRVKLLEACNELEEPVNLSTGRVWQKPTFPGEEDVSAMETMEVKGKMPQALAEEAATRARDRALKRRSTTGNYNSHAPKLPDTPERSTSSSATRPFDPINSWLEYTPPVSPLAAKQPLNPERLSEDPEDEPPVSPTWKPASDPTLLERRGGRPEALKGLEFSPARSEKALSTPALSSCASEEEFDIDIPHRPYPFALVDPRSVAPVLRNTAASLGLTKKAHQLATSASYVVFRPSTYIVSAMVSIATRVASTTTVGAAFITTEQGELKWRDDEDPLECLGYGSPPESPVAPWNPAEAWAVDH